MEQFDFHPQEKEFVVGANRSYIGHLPAHLAQADRTKDVARIVMFHLEEHNGATLQFKGGNRYATPYSGKALRIVMLLADIKARWQTIKLQPKPNNNH